MTNQIPSSELVARLAYAAGVIDSDGTIGVRRLTYAARVVGDCRQPSYCARLKVKQVNPEAVTLLKELFGGQLRVDKSSTKRGRPLHSWEIRDRLAEGCLHAILPFLRIKRLQAENCLRLREVISRSKIVRVAPGRGHMGAASRPAEISAEMEACFLRAKELNAVGVART